jgi:YCII-related domain
MKPAECDEATNGEGSRAPGLSEAPSARHPHSGREENPCPALLPASCSTLRRRTTVRLRDGRAATTNGPFVPENEALAGYLVFETDGLDAAIELATRTPQVKRGGAVEVRPIMEH